MAECEAERLYSCMCRDKAEELAQQLQAVYLRDKKASETVRAGVLEALGLLVEVAPRVRPELRVFP